MSSSMLEVAMVNEICPICCKETGHQLVMNKILNKNQAEKVKEMHGKTIGFSDPCEKCQGHLDNGYIALLGIDPEKSSAKDGTVKLENIYRTGVLIWIKKDKAEEVFGSQDNRPFILVENEVFDKLGIPLEEDNNE